MNENSICALIEKLRAAEWWVYDYSGHILMVMYIMLNLSGDC